VHKFIVTNEDVLSVCARLAVSQSQISGHMMMKGRYFTELNR